MKVLNLAILCFCGALVAYLHAPVDNMSFVARGGAHEEELEEISVAALCDIKGYFGVQCSTMNAACTGGTINYPEIEPNPPALFQTLPTTSVRGNCVGPAGCVTPATSDITSVGC